MAITSSPNHRPSVRREPPPAGRAEAQLRFEVTELQARLTEVTRCLEAAENRAAEMSDARDVLDQRLSVILASRSWRMTNPLRTVGRRLRSLF